MSDMENVSSVVEISPRPQGRSNNSNKVVVSFSLDEDIKRELDSHPQKRSPLVNGILRRWMDEREDYN